MFTTNSLCLIICRVQCTLRNIPEEQIFNLHNGENPKSPLGCTCWLFFSVFSTVHRSIELFHQPTLMHSFLYSLTICLLNYYPRHVSSINMPIFRRKNCIHTASVIFALCKHLHSTLVESGPLSTSVLCRRLQRAKIPDAVWRQFFLLKIGMLMLETCRG